MRTIQDIYLAYQLMPNLQLHQLRVAAVAKVLCDHFKGELDARSVVLAALLHDMGNIVKFNLELYPEFLAPEGLEYWQKRKEEFIAKYGSNSHEANVAIAKEIGVPKIVVSLIDGVSFSRMPETLERGSFEQKIVEYADTRVGPFGVLSIPDRFLDGAKRYAHRYASPEQSEAAYREHTEMGLRLEAQIFERVDIRPEDIDDARIAPSIEELKHFQVES